MIITLATTKVLVHISNHHLIFGKKNPGGGLIYQRGDNKSCAFFFAQMQVTPVKIVHVIGLVGAGKSHFIREFCPYAPVFDIQDVYKEYDISPDQLQGTAYGQFANALAYTLDNFFRHYSAENLLLIESSGLNRALNRYLLAMSHDTILIESSYSDGIALERSYATDLNRLITHAIDKHEITPTYRYNGDTGEFTPTRPDWIDEI